MPVWVSSSERNGARKPRHGVGDGGQPQGRHQTKPVPARDKGSDGRERWVVVKPPLVGQGDREDRASVAVLLQGANHFHTALTRGANRWFIAAEEVSGAGWAIARIRGPGDGPSAPLGRLEKVEPRAVALVEPDEQAAPVGLLPPEGRGTAKRRPATILVDSGKESMNSAVEQGFRTGAGSH